MFFISWDDLLLLSGSSKGGWAPLLLLGIGTQCTVLILRILVVLIAKLAYWRTPIELSPIAFLKLGDGCDIILILAYLCTPFELCPRSIDQTRRWMLNLLEQKCCCIGCRFGSTASNLWSTPLYTNFCTCRLILRHESRKSCRVPKWDFQLSHHRWSLSAYESNYILRLDYCSSDYFIFAPCLIGHDKKIKKKKHSII